MRDVLFPSQEHDHRVCIDWAITRAHQICAKRGVRLTPLREDVLRVLLSTHQAVGAYEIIDKLNDQGRKLAPISVYRILEVLLQAGLVHRLESKNAFFACLANHHPEKPVVVLVCERCQRVAEAEAIDVWSGIKSMTKEHDFLLSDTILEIKGLCSNCRIVTDA